MSQPRSSAGLPWKHQPNLPEIQVGQLVKHIGKLSIFTLSPLLQFNTQSDPKFSSRLHCPHYLPLFLGDYVDAIQHPAFLPPVDPLGTTPFYPIPFAKYQLPIPRSTLIPEMLVSKHGVIPDDSLSSKTQPTFSSKNQREQQRPRNKIPTPKRQNQISVPGITIISNPDT